MWTVSTVTIGTFILLLFLLSLLIHLPDRKEGNRQQSWTKRNWFHAKKLPNYYFLHIMQSYAMDELPKSHGKHAATISSLPPFHKTKCKQRLIFKHPANAYLYNSSSICTSRHKQALVHCEEPLWSWQVEGKVSDSWTVHNCHNYFESYWESVHCQFLGRKP